MRKDIISKISYVVCGAANVACGQILKGLIFLGIEISYILFMILTGFERLRGLITLGENVQGMAFNEELGIYEMSAGDNSMLILLSGVVTVVITIAFILFWLFTISSGRAALNRAKEGKHNNNFIEDIRSLANKNIRFLFLSVPVVGLGVFTVMPLIYMILMAFTNYDSNHQPPGNLFDWVGIKNFITLLIAKW